MIGYKTVSFAKRWNKKRQSKNQGEREWFESWVWYVMSKDTLPNSREDNYFQLEIMELSFDFWEQKMWLWYCKETIDNCLFWIRRDVSLDTSWSCVSPIIHLIPLLNPFFEWIRHDFLKSLFIEQRDMSPSWPLCRKTSVALRYKLYWPFTSSKTFIIFVLISYVLEMCTFYLLVCVCVFYLILLACLLSIY